MKRLIAALLLVSSGAWGQSPPPPPETPPEKAERAECDGGLGDGPPSVVCFDPGHRLYVSGGSDGLGWGIQVRHTVRTDDPGVFWRMEHGILRATSAADRFRGAAYEGRFLRHSREGYLLFPGNPPRRISVPFDVGLETAAGRVEGRRSSDELQLNAVRGALLMDFSRSETFRRRFALGVVARWDMTLSRERRTIPEQVVAPFSLGYLSLYAESANGLTLVGLNGEGGYATFGRGTGWRPVVHAELFFERTLLAFNDRPLSVYALGRYDHPGEIRGELGVRVALLAGAR